MSGRVRQAGIAQATLGYAITGLGACVVLLAGDLGVPPEQLAWLPATFGFGLLVMALAGPPLLRPGPRLALVTGSLTIATGATLLALATGLHTAITGALLLGAGGAAFVLVTPALLAGPGAAIRLTKASAIGSTAAVLAPAAVGALDATGIASGRLALLVVVPPLLWLAATARPTPTAPTHEPAGRPAIGTAAHPASRYEPAAGATACPAPTHEPASRPAASATAGPAPTHEPAGRPAGATAEPAPTHEPGDRPAVGAAARRWGVLVLAVSVEFCFTIWAVARLVEAGLPAANAAVFSTAFPIGMALGRLAGPAVITRIPIVPIGAAVTALGGVLVTAAGSPAAVTAALVLAGAGVATLYPVALAGLVATPGLRAAHAAALGTLASGTAILAAPAALARLADVVELRLAFLITLPLLAAMLLLHPRRRAVSVAP